jgi:hypothetical protein
MKTVSMSEHLRPSSLTGAQFRHSLSFDRRPHANLFDILAWEVSVILKCPKLKNVALSWIAPGAMRDEFW